MDSLRRSVGTELLTELRGQTAVPRRIRTSALDFFNLDDPRGVPKDPRDDPVLQAPLILRLSRQYHHQSACSDGYVVAYHELTMGR